MTYTEISRRIGLSRSAVQKSVKGQPKGRGRCDGSIRRLWRCQLLHDAERNGLIRRLLESA